MPKAYPDEVIEECIRTPRGYTDEEIEHRRWLIARQREEEFADGLQLEQEKFLKAVSDGKPYVDYVGLLTINAVIGALFGAGIHGLQLGEKWPERYLLMMLVALFLSLKIYGPLWSTNEAIAAKSLIRFAQLFRLPYPFHHTRSATLRVLFAVYMDIVAFLMMIGAGAIGYEVAQRTISALGQNTPAQTDAQKQTTTSTPAAPPKMEPLPPLP